MNDLVIKYTLDLAARKPENLIHSESHELKGNINRYIVPVYGAFYTHSLKVVDLSTNQELVVNDQYLPIMYNEQASARSGREVHTGIVIIDYQVSSTVSITYHMVGGSFTTTAKALLDHIESINIDDFDIIYGDLLGLEQGVSEKLDIESIEGLVTFEHVVEALEDIRKAILIGDEEDHLLIEKSIEDTFNQLSDQGTYIEDGLNVHRSDNTNPHNLTKLQIGLDLVENYSIATKEEAESGDIAGLYLTPLRVKQAIDYQIKNEYLAYKQRTDNPHSVTKEQVGLGNMHNYLVATKEEAQACLATNKYMTPLRVKEAIYAKVGSILGDHTSLTNNPHEITKADIGLSLVQNYSVASEAQAQAATLNDKYVTPIRTKQCIDAKISEALSIHVSSKNNPHNVTKLQIGLGNVNNFDLATTAQAQAGTDNTKYMTPLSLKQAIDYQITQAFSAHTYNTNNPHNVTKSQVGLSNILNYGVATDAEAKAGIVNDKYITASGLSLAISTQTASATTHINTVNSSSPLGSNNPHNVTKAQIGLGSVENYPIASTAEAQAGSANNRYMTPLKVKQAIEAIAPTFSSKWGGGDGVQVWSGSATSLTVAQAFQSKVGLYAVYVETVSSYAYSLSGGQPGYILVYYSGYQMAIVLTHPLMNGGLNVSPTDISVTNPSYGSIKRISRIAS